MNRVPPNSEEQNRLAQTAAEWLARCDAGLSAREQQDLLKWISADARHEEAFKRIEQAWGKMETLRGYQPRAARHPDPDLLVRPVLRRPQRRIGRFTRISALAAAVALGASALIWTRSGPPTVESAEPSIVYSTGNGGYQRLTLADGSVVDLNSNSEVEVAYNDSERRVSLTRGEAHFTVAKNETHPFRVEVNGLYVQAVGTAFSVKKATRDVEVLVTAGIVKLNRDDEARAEPSSGIGLLTAGLRAIVPNSGDAALVEKVSADQIRSLLSWQSSRLVFVDMPLAEVVEQFNQRNDLQLVVQDGDLSQLPVGGSFDSQNVEAFVRLLTSSGDVAAERTASNRIVLRRAR